MHLLLLNYYRCTSCNSIIYFNSKASWWSLKNYKIIKNKRKMTSPFCLPNIITNPYYCIFFFSFFLIIAFYLTHCFSISDSLWPYGLLPTSLLYPWDSPGKNTGVDHCSFSRGSSWPRHWTWVSYISCIGRRVLYHLHHQESPVYL